MATAHTSQSDDWLSSQKQYWDQLLDTQRKMMESAFPRLEDQWGAFFREWQGQVRPGDGPLPGAEAYQSFFTQAGKQFLDMLQTFQQAGQEKKSPHATAQEWADNLQTLLADMLQQGASSADAYRNFASWSESMVKAGQAWSGALRTGGGPFVHNWRTQHFDPFGFAASLPGLGYTREKQEDWRELYTLWNEFEHLSQKYNAAMSGVGMEAVRKFQDYLANPPKDAAPLKSLKEVYIKWVDVCEELYASYAMSEEYTVLYGQTVNALMACQKKTHAIADDMADSLGLPTRKETDSLHKRMHDLRRDNRQLRREMDALKAAVFRAAKAQAPKAAPPKAPAPKKAAGRKGKKK